MTTNYEINVLVNQSDNIINYKINSITFEYIKSEETFTERERAVYVDNTNISVGNDRFYVYTDNLNDSGNLMVRYYMKIVFFPHKSNKSIEDLEKVVAKIYSGIGTEDIIIHLPIDKSFLYFIENLDSFKYIVSIFLLFNSNQSSITVEQGFVFYPYENRTSIDLPTMKFNKKVDIRLKEKSKYYSNLKQSSLSILSKDIFYKKQRYNDKIMLEDRIARIDISKNNLVDTFVSFASYRGKYNNMNYFTLSFEDIQASQSLLGLNVHINRDGTLFPNYRNEYVFNSSFVHYRPMFIETRRINFGDTCNSVGQSQRSPFLTPFIVLHEDKNNYNIVYLGYEKVPIHYRFNRIKSKLYKSVHNVSINKTTKAYGLDYNKSIFLSIGSEVEYETFSSIFTFSNIGYCDNDMYYEYETFLYKIRIYDQVLDQSRDPYYEMAFIAVQDILGSGDGYILTKIMKKFYYRNALTAFGGNIYYITYRNMINVYDHLSNGNTRNAIYRINKYHYSIH
ncbi:MAG: hypothetical protein QXF12_03445 [Candidatus Aenigmatarchaeota archaeon]